MRFFPSFLLATVVASQAIPAPPNGAPNGLTDGPRKGAPNGPTDGAPVGIPTGNPAGAPAGAANDTKEQLTPEKLQAAVTQGGLMKHAKELDSIAEKNGGNRATGTQGYAKSVEYVKSVIQPFVKSGQIKLSTQNFTTKKSRKTTWNVIAETLKGDANNVVMVGAHLDGVNKGRGMNDNASGSSALLNMLEALCASESPRNKVRFAWWGAEEEGLVGSTHYVQGLSEAEGSKLRFYFNYDMIGSREPAWSVMARSQADQYGAKILVEQLEQSKMKNGPVKVTKAPFAANSDYAPFVKAGIPSAGMATGAASQNDPCYHQACDKLNNINPEALTISAKAASYALGKLAIADFNKSGAAGTGGPSATGKRTPKNKPSS